MTLVTAVRLKVVVDGVQRVDHVLQLLAQLITPVVRMDWTGYQITALLLFLHVTRMTLVLLVHQTPAVDGAKEATRVYQQQTQTT